VKIPTLLALCLTPGLVLVFGKCAGANDDVVELVSRVKVTPAAQIDPALPPVALGKWLDTQAGTDAAIAWVVSTADRPRRGISLREADILPHGRPGMGHHDGRWNITGRDRNQTNVPLAPSGTGSRLRRMASPPRFSLRAETGKTRCIGIGAATFLRWSRVHASSVSIRVV
jgi:hypothetical protein